MVRSYIGKLHGRRFGLSYIRITVDLVASPWWGGKSGQHREPHFPKGKAHSTECDRKCFRDSNRRWPSGTGKGEKVG